MRKTFRDYLQSDVEQVFFNDTEFATTMKIDNKPVKVVVDGDKLSEYNSSLSEGLTRGELLFYAPVSHFEKELFEGKEITVRNRRHEIIDVSINEGVYYVVLVGMQ